MADNTTLPGTGDVIADEDIGGVKFQKVISGWGAPGAYQKTDIASGKPLPVQMRSATGLTPIGEPTDAAATATDTTSVSAISIWKQISKSIQLMVFGAGPADTAQRTTLASDDPAVAALGAIAGAKVITDANGTIQQYLRGLVSQWIAGTLTFATSARSVAVAVTPAPSSHAAVDAVGNSGASAIMTFANLFGGAGEYEFTDAELSITSGTALASSFTAYIYESSPTAINDDAAWSLGTADEFKYLDKIDLGTPVKLGAVLKVKVSNLGLRVTATGTSGFVILVNNSTITTPAVAHTITLKTTKVY